MKVLLTVLAILTVIVGFYWFGVRPSDSRNYCDQVAWAEMYNNRPIEQKTYDWKYEQCLHSQGLK